LGRCGYERLNGLGFELLLTNKNSNVPTSFLRRAASVFVCGGRCRRTSKLQLERDAALDRKQESFEMMFRSTLIIPVVQTGLLRWTTAWPPESPRRGSAARGRSCGRFFMHCGGRRVAAILMDRFTGKPYDIYATADMASFLRASVLWNVFQRAVVAAPSAIPMMRKRNRA